jgi:hypothetical protein
LRCLPAIGHPVLTDDANLAMAQRAPRDGLGFPMLGVDRISPCDEKQQLAGIGDALEDLLIGVCTENSNPDVMMVKAAEDRV